MNKILILLILNLLFFGSHSLSFAESLTKDDVLSIRDGRFFLDGKPFAEISFNKFDILWELYDELDAGRPLDGTNRLLVAQEKALKNLHDMGFRTIRIFGLPWGPRGPESYADPEKRKNLYAAMDKTLDICNKYGIWIVYSLFADNFTDWKIVPGKGWVYGKEHLRELVGNPESRGRKLLYAYLDETVARYKERKGILMWEITNELTLRADIGDKERVYHGQRMPTLKQVAVFYDDVAKRIKAIDPLRLVSNGGSNMRESQWHLYQKEHSWGLDTFEQQFKCFQLLFANSAVDVIDIHSYPNNTPGYTIMGEDGHKTILDHKGYRAIALRLGKPLMIGELGVLPAAKTDKKIWDVTPDYFESFDDTAAAKPWVQKTLNSIIDAGVQLIYWWCYQSDRPMDQGKPQRFDIDLERNPDLLAIFVEANKRLKAKLKVAQ